MKTGRKLTILVLLAVCLVLTAGAAFAEQLTIVIMQDSAGDARLYTPLVDYLGQKGIEASFKTAPDYPAAAQMFAGGQADAMFSGSGVAGTMIIKGLAEPIVRPEDNNGISTYWAVVIAPKGAPAFKGSADYFKGKKVAFSPLASSGEFYFHSLENAEKAGATVIPAPSHSAAIDIVNRGRADVAIVKNRVWDKDQGKYSKLAKVGEDNGENPNGTLIVSTKTSAATVNKLKTIMLGIGDDKSSSAAEVKKSLKIKGYIETTKDDFTHTLALLKKAGVTESFNFSY